MDIALAKGGPEAIAESFYASMRCPQQPVWQTNENLVWRTKVYWCLPSLVNSESIISEAVNIKEIKKFLHRGLTHFLHIEQKSPKYPKSSVVLKVK